MGYRKFDPQVPAYKVVKSPKMKIKALESQLGDI